jgi:predicted nucleic-acid-binding Zn-ribbon protein
MDTNFPGSNVYSWTTTYRDRTGESLNLAVNAIVDVLHMLVVESGMPVVPWNLIFVACFVSVVAAGGGIYYWGRRGKCKKCGEESHRTEEMHSTKTKLYEIAKESELANRSKYSGENLADFAASYTGKRIILVERGTHSAGWFFHPRLIMVHDSQPRPAKLVLPNSAVVWRTDSENNRPVDAREYKVSKVGATMSAQYNCRCGAGIKVNRVEKKLKCPNCGRQYEFMTDSKDTIWLWGGPAQIEFKIDEIKKATGYSINHVVVDARQNPPSASEL